MKDEIQSIGAPAAIGPYSQGICTKELVFISGQLPINPENGDMPKDVAEQTRQSLVNAKAILEAANLDMSKVVKTTILLTDIDDFNQVNKMYETFFSKPYPARSCFAVAALPKNASVEIEIIAVKE